MSGLRELVGMASALFFLGALGSACSGKSTRDAPMNVAAGAGGAGAGGAGAGGAGGDVTCPDLSILFKLSLPPGSNSKLCIGSLGSCYVSNWITIRSAAGSVLGPTGGCTTPCSTCEPTPCLLLCGQPSALTTEGTTFSWNGGYAQPGSCGAGVMCLTPACAAAGDYVAEMCAFDETDPTQPDCALLAATPRCVEVPFHWPPASPAMIVSATLGNAG